MKIKRKRFVTNPHFWDCECEDRYIHPKSDKTCSRCGSESCDQPDSRDDEVMRYLKLHNPKTTMQMSLLERTLAETLSDDGDQNVDELLERENGDLPKGSKKYRRKTIEGALENLKKRGIARYDPVQALWAFCDNDELDSPWLHRDQGDEEGDDDDDDDEDCRKTEVKEGVFGNKLEYIIEDGDGTKHGPYAKAEAERTYLTLLSQGGSVYIYQRIDPNIKVEF